MRRPPFLQGMLMCVVAVIVLALLWYFFADETHGDFPFIPAVGPVHVFKSGGLDRVCDMEGRDAAHRVVTELANRYPRGWRNAPLFVNYAPQYTMTIGKTEVLVSEGLLVVPVTGRVGRPFAVIRELARGDAEALVRWVCENAK